MPSNFQKLCIHTITTKPWSLEEALDQYAAKGVGGISIWQDAVEAAGLKKAAALVRQSPVKVVSYVRGGFFPSTEPAKRQKAIDHNRQLIDEAAEIGAPLLVLVCGADPGQSLNASRTQIRSGIEAILSHAAANSVKLGIEPLHPMYADTRSAINTLGQANTLVEAIDSPYLGIVVDVYHLWWDSHLSVEIQRCGSNGNLFAYHICDWKVPTRDMLLDRGLMGEGCIPIKQISQWVEQAGFAGFREVEIFSKVYWEMDQSHFLDKIIKAYNEYA